MGRYVTTAYPKTRHASVLFCMRGAVFALIQPLHRRWSRPVHGLVRNTPSKFIWSPMATPQRSAQRPSVVGVVSFQCPKVIDHVRDTRWTMNHASRLGARRTIRGKSFGMEQGICLVGFRATTERTSLRNANQNQQDNCQYYLHGKLPFPLAYEGLAQHPCQCLTY